MCNEDLYLETTMREPLYTYPNISQPVTEASTSFKRYVENMPSVITKLDAARKALLSGFEPYAIDVSVIYDAVLEARKAEHEAQRKLFEGLGVDAVEEIMHHYFLYWEDSDPVVISGETRSILHTYTRLEKAIGMLGNRTGGLLRAFEQYRECEGTYLALASELNLPEYPEVTAWENDRSKIDKVKYVNAPYQVE